MAMTPFQRRLTTAWAAVTRWTPGLIREMAPVVLFFFIAFLLIFLLLKLFVSQYSIEFYAFSKAAIAALIVGKVILVLDWAESGRSVSTYPRAVVVVCKTLVYGLAVIVLGIGERIFDGYREAGSLRDGVRLVLARTNLDRFLGLVLLISLVVGAYLIMEEIDRAMGPGALFRLFFKRPVGSHSGPSEMKQ